METSAPNYPVRRMRPRLHIAGVSLCTVMLALCGVAASSAGAATPKPKGPAVPSARTLYQDGPNGMYLLEGPWLYRSDPGDVGLAQGFQRQVDNKGWTETHVPNAFNAGDYSQRSMDGSIGWYRKDFTLPSAHAFRWAIRFESANYRAQVWLNGKEIGKHEGAYLPFEEVTGVAHRGVNHLVVRVNSRRNETDIPSSKAQGWWNWGGILREVYLRRVGQLDMDDVLVAPKLSNGNRTATIKVRVKVKNRSTHKRGGLRGLLFGFGAKRGLSFSAKPVPGFGTKTYVATVKLRKPRLWSPGNPNLYRVRLAVGPDKHPDQTWSTHFGVRTWSVSPGGRILLNGRAINLRGASIHESDINTGAALSPAQRGAEFNLLERLHANFTRSHYPLHPWTLEQADRKGIVVWDEIPFYQLRQRYVAQPFVRDKGLIMLRAMIKRDQNHASVMTYSVANEIAPYLTGPAINYIRRAAQTIHQNDPTKLAAIAINGYPTVPRQGPYNKLDVLGLNSYFGWYTGPGGSILHREGLGPYLDQMHAVYPRMGLVVTEFGAEANRNGPATEKGTFAFQTDWALYTLGVIATKPFISGALYWTLQEFPVKPGWDGGNPVPSPPFHKKGLVDIFGNPKPAFSRVEKVYAATSPFRR